MGDPLFDTLFRSTTPDAAAPPPRLDAAQASEPPVRPPGTRARAGNAMQRSRAALLDGARRAVAHSGTKITMAEVAAASGVAKATLYNHFRTRDAVLSALLLSEIDAVAADADELPLEQGLLRVAVALRDHPLLATLAAREPASLAALARIDLTAAGWQRAHAVVAQRLAAQGWDGAGTALRWLASYLVSPAEDEEIAADLAVLLAGLPPRPTRTGIARSA